MISIAATSIASRRRRLLQSAHEQQSQSPPRHCHRNRPRPLSKKGPLVKPTRAISAPESEARACSAGVREDEYAQAMAARARLHARLHSSALVTCPTRSSSLARVVHGGNLRSPMMEANTESSTSASSNVHTSLARIALSKQQKESKIAAYVPLHDASEQTEELLPETDDCSICLESFSAGKILICWPCRHRFHHRCLTCWLGAHAQCPNCRAHVLKVISSQSSVEFPSTSYGSHFEKTSTSWKVSSRTSPSH